MDYKNKYLKYKYKYNNLKKKIYGGYLIKKNTCKINKNKKIKKKDNNIKNYNIWSAKKLDKSIPFGKVELLNVVELKDIDENDLIYIGENCFFYNELFRDEGKRIKLSLIGPIDVFQTNINGREILLLGDQHHSTHYKKNGKLIDPYIKLKDLYENYNENIRRRSIESFKSNQKIDYENKNIYFNKITKELLNEYIKYYDENKIKEYIQRKYEDIFIFDYIYYLATNKYICIDLFMEEEIYKQKYKEFMHTKLGYLSLVNFFFLLCGKGDDKYKLIENYKLNNIIMDKEFCLKKYKSIRYHQGDTRLYWMINVLQIKQNLINDFPNICIYFIRVYISSLNSNISKSSNLVKMFENTFEINDNPDDQEFIEFSNKLVNFNNRNMSSIDLFIEEFKLIKKQFEKSEFSDNLEKVKTVYIKILEENKNLYGGICGFTNNYISEIEKKKSSLSYSSTYYEFI